MFGAHLGRTCLVLQHTRVRLPSEAPQPHLRDTCRIGSPFPARQGSQRLDAAKHAGVEAPQGEQPRSAQPAPAQRDDRSTAIHKRLRVEPGLVDIPQTREEALVLLEQLQQDTAQWGSEEGINLVAFGGGVASTLAAFLVHSVFEARSVAVFGVSRSTTEGQLQRARTLAECLGIELWELPTADEGRLAEVSVGEAEATRHPELAATVAAVAGWLAAPEFDGATVVLFDGRHAEDLAGFDWPEYRRESWWDGSEDSGDLLAPARAIALESWDVTPEAASLEQPAEERALRVSLMARLPEVAVRAVAKEAGLPNWAWLDPRYSYDMEFAEPSCSGLPVIDTLPAAESLISELLDADDDASIRLRVEGTSSSVLEVEESLLPRAQELHHQLDAHLRGLGLPPVSLEPAPQSTGNGTTASRHADMAERRANGVDPSAGEAGAPAHEGRNESRAAGNGSGSSGGAAGSQASLERIQRHINGSSGGSGTLTAAPAGSQGARMPGRHSDDTASGKGETDEGVA